MNKLILIIFLSSLVSCTEKKAEPSDDYVLIEFASKLEEEHAKFEETQKK